MFYYMKILSDKMYKNFYFSWFLDTECSWGAQSTVYNPGHHQRKNDQWEADPQLACFHNSFQTLWGHCAQSWICDWHVWACMGKQYRHGEKIHWHEQMCVNL